MFVGEEAVGPSWRNTYVRGYGSRVALRLPGTTWMDLSIRISNSHDLISLPRHCERQRSNPWLGIARSKMDCFAPLAMTAVLIAHTSSHSRGVKTPELCQQPPS